MGRLRESGSFTGEKLDRRMMNIECIIQFGLVHCYSEQNHGIFVPFPKVIMAWTS